MAHILVDFDRTLAFYESMEKNGSSLGHPIPAMVERVKRWLQQGLEVRVFSARASELNLRWREDIVEIQKWCNKYIGKVLPVTNQKEFGTLAIWDDLAVSIEPNTGWRWSVEVAGPNDPLNDDEERYFSEVAMGTKEYEPLKKEKWVLDASEEFCVHMLGQDGSCARCEGT